MFFFLNKTTLRIHPLDLNSGNVCYSIFNLTNIKVKIKAMVCHVAKCASNFTRGKTKWIGGNPWKGLIECTIILMVNELI